MMQILMTASSEQIICNALFDFTWTLHLLVNWEEAIFISQFITVEVYFLDTVSEYSY